MIKTNKTMSDYMVEMMRKSKILVYVVLKLSAAASSEAEQVQVYYCMLYNGQAVMKDTLSEYATASRLAIYQLKVRVRCEGY